MIYKFSKVTRVCKPDSEVQRLKSCLVAVGWKQLDGLTWLSPCGEHVSYGDAMAYARKQFSRPDPQSSSPS